MLTSVFAADTDFVGPLLLIEKKLRRNHDSMICENTRAEITR